MQLSCGTGTPWPPADTPEKRTKNRRSDRIRTMTKYSVNQHSVSVLLGWIESDNIAIPEMQRPFVWTSAKVRDLMDSLYRGFPVGYLITWQSPVIPVKGGAPQDSSRSSSTVSSA